MYKLFANFHIYVIKLFLAILVIGVLLGFASLAVFNTQTGYKIAKRLIPTSIEQRAFFELNSISREFNLFQFFRRSNIDESSYIDLQFSENEINYIKKKKEEFLKVGYIKDELNPWRNAKIRIKSDLYDVKYKFQGTSVSSLDRYSIVSYKIKLKKKNPYYSSFRRINLINILEEATTATIASNSFAKKLNLLGFESKIVPLRVNGVLARQPYIFYEDLKEEWLERDHQITNFSILKPNDDWDKKEDSHRSAYDLYVQNYEQYTNNPKPEIALGKLNSLLSSVRAKDVKEIKNLIDLDYFARYIAYSYLVNSSHSVYGDNLKFLYDFSCGCFKIIFRNEGSISRISNVIENFNSSWLNSIPRYSNAETFDLFNLLQSDSDFRKKRDFYLRLLVEQRSVILRHFQNTFDSNIDVINTFHFPVEERFEFSRNLNNVRSNLQRIETYLNYAKIYLTYDISTGQLTYACDSYRNIHLHGLQYKEEYISLEIHCGGKLDDNLKLIPSINERYIPELKTLATNNMEKPKIKANFEQNGTIAQRNFYFNKVISSKPMHKTLGWDNKLNIKINVEKKHIHINQGTYTLHEDITFPVGYSVEIDEGTKIFLDKGVSILIQGSLTANGTSELPIIINRSGKKPFGVFAVNGINDQNSFAKLSNFTIKGGSEAYVNGTQFLGQLSIYNVENTTLSEITVMNSKSDDGLNVKNSKVEIENSYFINNDFDQVDLDYSDGIVRDSEFVTRTDKLTSGGDGLDVSGSVLKIERNKFQGFDDKGISVGEMAKVKINENFIYKNNIGVAVKDGSKATFEANIFSDNEIDVDAYTKKKIYSNPEIDLINQEGELTVRSEVN